MHIFPMILFVLVIVAVGLGKCNSLKIISSNEEYTIFRSQQTPHAIFYHHSGDGSLQSKFLYDFLFIYEALFCIG